MSQNMVALCHRHCKGSSQLSLQQQQNLREYFGDINNGLQIIKVAHYDTHVLICFNAITKEMIRNGKYFGITNMIGNDHQKSQMRDNFLKQVLKIFSVIPSHDHDLSAKNMYLSVIGTILANFINFNSGNTEKYAFFDHLFSIFTENKGKHILITIYQTSKILQSTLQQLSILQKNYTANFKLYKTLWLFIQIYFERFSSTIVYILQTLTQFMQNTPVNQITNFYQVIKRISSTICYTIQILNQLIGINQQPNQSPSFQHYLFTSSQEQKQQKNKNKAVRQRQQIKIRTYFRNVFAIKWHKKHIVANIQDLCSQIGILMQLNINQNQLQKIIYQKINIISTLYHVLMNYHKQQLKLQEQQQWMISKLLWDNLIVNHCLAFVNNDGSKCINPTKSNSIQASIIKILIDMCPYLIKNCSGVNFQQQQILTELEMLILNYCQQNLHYYRSLYQTPSQCVIMLTFKLLDSFKYSRLKDLQQNVNNESDEEKVKIIEKIYQKKIKTCFKMQILQPLVMNDDQIYNNRNNLQHQQENNDIINYEEYITQVLTHYFDQLITYGPKFMEDDGQPKHRILLSRDTKESDEPNQIMQLRHFILFQDNSDDQFDDMSNDMSQLSETSATKYSEKMYGDFQLLTNFIESIQIQYKRQLHEFVKKSHNNYINTKTLPLLVCLNSILNKIPQSQLKSQLFLSLYQLMDCFQMKVYEQQFEISKADEIQLCFCKLYLLDVFLKQIIPDRFIKEGSQASLTATIAERKKGITLFDYVLDALQNITEVIQCQTFMESEENITDRNQDKFDDDNDALQDLITYGLAIFEEISVKISERVSELDQQHNIKINETTICQDLLNFIYDQIKEYKFSTPQSNYKLYSLAGLITDMFQVSSIYETYNKLRQDSFESKNVALYFSGICGIIAFCTHKKKLRILLELVISQLAQSHMLQNVDDQNMEYFVHFAQSVTSKKIFKETHDELNLKIQDLLYPYLKTILPEALRVPDFYEATIQVYKNYALIQSFAILPHLPFNTNYPYALLNLYFQNIDRVTIETLLTLPNYIHKNMDWFITLLTYQIENNNSELAPYINMFLSIDNISANFKASNFQDKFTELCGLIHYLDPKISTKDVKQRIQERNLQIMSILDKQRNQIRQFYANNWQVNQKQ